MLRTTVLLVICLVSSYAFLAWQTITTDTWKSKIDHDVLAAAEAGEKDVSFIVYLKKQPDVSAAKQLKGKMAKGRYVFSLLQQNAEKTQANIRQILRENQRPFQSLFIINAIHSRGDLALIRRLALLPEVARLNNNPTTQLDYPELETSATLRDPSTTEWGIDIIGAPEVWSMGYRGQGVVIAGQDTGYDWTHPALQSKYRGWDGSDADHNYNWHDAIHEISEMSPTDTNPCGLDLTEPCDDHSHGTHTMGTMVGEDGENQIGVAPEAKWIACRNMERGNGTPITYLECYEWFLAPTDLSGENPDPDKSPHVINNSWSCPESEGCNPTNWPMMETAINNLRAAGVVVVVSAGNGGRGGCETVNTASAIFEGSFSIGSVHPNDTISSFSSRGPVAVDSSFRVKPNVSAPGGQVRSSIPNNAYATFSGTSMAGPHVVGLVALMISAAPALAGEVELIEDIIEQTALAKNSSQDCGDYTGTGIPNNTYGFGRIQAIEAVEEAIRQTATSTESLLNAQNLLVYPNPSKDLLYIELLGWKGVTQLDFFSADGRLLFSQPLVLDGYDVEEVSLVELPDGLYFYRIHNKEQVMSGRVVKQ